MNDKLVIQGAKENNLKNVNLTIPRNKLVVFTGLSGSGKSSLAFDTIYAEGQRRYVESLSSYARQFLGIMEKPNVEYIEGLSPAISIDQKTTSKNPRSTVGTVTEIYDYLRLLYARIGVPYCPNCGRKIEKQTVDQIVDNVQKLKDKGISSIINTIGELLAGFVVPLPLLPNLIINLSEYLPFRLIGDLPFRIYSGNIAGNYAIKCIILQIIWVILLMIIGKLVMNKALKKVSIQGG